MYVGTSFSWIARLSLHHAILNMPPRAPEFEVTVGVGDKKLVEHRVGNRKYLAVDGEEDFDIQIETDERVPWDAACVRVETTVDGILAQSGCVKLEDMQGYFWSDGAAHVYDRAGETIKVMSMRFEKVAKKTDSTLRRVNFTKDEQQDAGTIGVTLTACRRHRGHQLQLSSPRSRRAFNASGSSRVGDKVPSEMINGRGITHLVGLALNSTAEDADSDADVKPDKNSHRDRCDCDPSSDIEPITFTFLYRSKEEIDRLSRQFQKRSPKKSKTGSQHAESNPETLVLDSQQTPSPKPAPQVTASLLRYSTPRRALRPSPLAKVRSVERENDALQEDEPDLSYLSGPRSSQNPNRKDHIPVQFRVASQADPGIGQHAGDASSHVQRPRNTQTQTQLATTGVPTSSNVRSNGSVNDSIVEVEGPTHSSWPTSSSSSRPSQASGDEISRELEQDEGREVDRGDYGETGQDDASETDHERVSLTTQSRHKLEDLQEQHAIEEKNALVKENELILLITRKALELVHINNVANRSLNARIRSMVERRLKRKLGAVHARVDEASPQEDGHEAQDGERPRKKTKGAKGKDGPAKASRSSGR